MKNYFTKENTEGFTEEELKKLNRIANEKIGDETDENIIKGICDRINNEWPNLEG